MGKSKKKKQARVKSKGHAHSASKQASSPVEAGKNEKPVRAWWLSCSIVLVVALLLRLAYLVEIHDEPDFVTPWIDAAYHDVWARGIAFDAWQVPQGMNDPEIQQRPYFRPPGYPFFLAAVYKATGGSYWAPRLVQIVLGLLSVLGVMVLARRVFDARTALWAGGLLALSWAAIHFEGQLMAPSLLIALGCALVLVLERWCHAITLRNGVLAGVIFGAFAVIRPNILLFGPVIVAWGFWLGKRRGDPLPVIRGCLGLCLGTALMIAPITWRNYRVSGTFVPITCNAGINLHIGNNPKADGMSAVFPELSRLTGMDGWTSFDYPKIVAGVSRETGKQMSDADVSAFFTQKALTYIRHNPARVLGLMAKKAALFWGPAEISNNKELQVEKDTSWVLRFLPGFPWILAFSVLGMILFFWPQKPRRESAAVETAVLLLALVFVYFLSYLPFFVIGRFRVPLLPFLMVFAGFALSTLVDWIRQKKTAALVRWVPVAVGLVALAHCSVVTRGGDQGLWHYHKGIALETQGRADVAMVQFRRALALRPEFADAWEKLGISAYRSGDIQAAVDAWMRVLELRSDAEVRNNLAWVFATDEALKDPAKALAYAQEACDATGGLDPGKLDTLAVAQAANGRFEEATETARRAMALTDPQEHGTLIKDLKHHLKRFEAGLEAVQP